MRRQGTKSISFFMELMIVIFFFTIAAGICVMVMSNAHNKSNEADDIKKALLYGQNAIENRCMNLAQTSFQFDDKGNITSSNGEYDVNIVILKKGTTNDLCEMHILKDNKELTVLTFYRMEDTTYGCE